MSDPADRAERGVARDMRRSQSLRSGLFAGLFGLAAIAVPTLGAEDTKQTVDAKGMKFQAPASWKSSPPESQMRRAQLKVEPIEGDDYPAELVVFAFRSAGSVEDNLKRWQGMFKDKEGNKPKIESKKVKGKNVEVTRAEIAGDYHPAQLVRPEPDRADARLLGAIIMTDQGSYYIRMVGPDKTMKKLRKDFDDLLSTIEVDPN
jgi:hypothetical protein